MKRCPFCAEEIQDDAIKCRHCGSWLESPDLPLEPSGGTAPPAGGPPPASAPPPQQQPYLQPPPGQQPRQGPPPTYPAGSAVPKMIEPKPNPDDPVLMGLLSGCCIGGLGQILVGQTNKGLALLIGNVVLAVMTMGFSALVTFPLTGIDAYMVAKRLKDGKPVAEWEFFPSS